MNTPQKIAKQIRSLHSGPNWTGVCLKEKLVQISQEEAEATIPPFHSIATLLFHLNYYEAATVVALETGELNASDQFSFDCPPFKLKDDWSKLLAKVDADADQLVTLIECLPESQMDEVFIEPKNGTYFRCLQGLIEHGYYHLGQIAMIGTLVKKHPQMWK